LPTHSSTNEIEASYRIVGISDKVAYVAAGKRGFGTLR
jgi:hypothetical protein